MAKPYLRTRLTFLPELVTGGSEIDGYRGPAVLDVCYGTRGKGLGALVCCVKHTCYAYTEINISGYVRCQ
jgi:hypothetical protein